MLTQYHSDYTLLLNESGVRFCDESIGDHASVYDTTLQPNSRTICFWDSRVHEAHATTAVVKFAAPFDKFDFAIENGGRGVKTDRLEDIGAFASANGFDGAQSVRSITAFNHAATMEWEKVFPRRAQHGAPLDKPPFYALIVRSAITFTYGGAAIDPNGHVLRANGSRLPGLFAAGSDAGGAFGQGYAGGLAMAMTFGIRAAQAAGWPMPND